MDREADALALAVALCVALSSVPPCSRQRACVPSRCTSSPDGTRHLLHPRLRPCDRRARRRRAVARLLGRQRRAVGRSRHRRRRHAGDRRRELRSQGAGAAACRDDARRDHQGHLGQRSGSAAIAARTGRSRPPVRGDGREGQLRRVHRTEGYASGPGTRAGSSAPRRATSSPAKRWSTTW